MKGVELMRARGWAVGILVVELVLGVGLEASGSCPSLDVYPGVCLDPGHGGPGACKWNPPCVNGDGFGCCGPVPDTCGSCCVTEAWVNHEIAGWPQNIQSSSGFIMLNKLLCN